MIRALVIAPTASHPPVQGNRVRILQMVHAVKASGGTVDYLCYDLDRAEPDAIASMGDAWDSVFVVGAEGFALRKSQGDMWGLDDWIAPSILTAARILAVARRYDLVIVNYVWLSALLEPFAETGARLLLDTHDAFGDRDLASAAAGVAPNWFYTTKEEEARGFDRADVVVAIQAEEGSAFAARTRKPVAVVEYAAPATFLPARSSGDAVLQVGYVGSGNPWNIRSVEAFDAALARSSAFARTEGRFAISAFGGVCAALPATSVVARRGAFSDLADVYGACDLFVNPMSGGTGLKIKTVEALAFGRPILSTAAGGAGLETLHPDLAHADINSLVDRLAGLRTVDQVRKLGEEMTSAYLDYSASVERKLFALLHGGLP